MFGIRPESGPRQVAGVGQAQPMLYRQGTIVAWNPLTLENIIEVDGGEFANLSINGTAEVATYKVGAKVAVQQVGEQWAIAGRWVVPTSPEASDALGYLSAFIKTTDVSAFQNITSTSYQDLATVGPTVSNVHIGPTGAALVLITSQLSVNEQGSAAYMSFAVSGASTIAADDGRALQVSKSGTLVAANMIIEIATTKAVYLNFLTPGDNTFTAKYRIGSTAGVASAQAGNRNLTVIPL